MDGMNGETKSMHAAFLARAFVSDLENVVNWRWAGWLDLFLTR